MGHDMTPKHSGDPMSAVAPTNDTRSSPDELRKWLASEPLRGNLTVGEYDYGIAFADAWEADKRDLEDFRSENATLREDDAALRTRLEGSEMAIREKEARIVDLEKRLEAAVALGKAQCYKHANGDEACMCEQWAALAGEEKP